HEYVSMEYAKKVLQLTEDDINKLYQKWEYNTLGIPTIVELELMEGVQQGIEVEEVVEEVVYDEVPEQLITGEEENMYEITIEGEVPEELKTFFDMVMGSNQNNINCYKKDLGDFIHHQKNMLKEGMLNDVYTMEEVQLISSYLMSLERVLEED